MKLFVTGGTGFIGSHFLNQAIAAGHDVIAQRRPGSRPRLHLPREPVWVDRALDQIFEAELVGCDAIVHLAAHTPNPPYAALDECIYWNVYATTKLIQQAVSAGVKNVIIAGTCFEYGGSGEGQFRIHPKTEMRPTLTYPISKALATTSCIGLAKFLNIKLQVLRIFQVYGEGESPTRFWPSLRSAALEGRDFPMSAGSQIRDFIYVGNVVEIFINSLNFEGVKSGKPIIKNVGTGEGKTLIEFASSNWIKWGAVGKLLPGLLLARDGEYSRIVANIEDVYEA
jgi:nucleoside-diphosphate-sugar epimerase